MCWIWLGWEVPSQGKGAGDNGDKREQGGRGTRSEVREVGVWMWFVRLLRGEEEAELR